MKTFSELLVTNYYLTIEIDGNHSTHLLNDPISIEIDGGYQLTLIDGFEIKDWQGEVIDGVWVFRCDNFYQWKHHATDQGWLFYQNTN